MDFLGLVVLLVSRSPRIHCFNVFSIDIVQSTYNVNESLPSCPTDVSALNIACIKTSLCFTMFIRHFRTDSLVLKDFIKTLFMREMFQY